MNRNYKLQTMTIAALLSAIGILIPMYAPKIVIPPASYTLASHVPIFIAMFISPFVAIAVAIISGFGFLIAGFPLVIVLRAFSHIVFATVGGFILKKYGNLLSTTKSTVLFSLFVSLIHAVFEVGVVTFFYWGTAMPSTYYDKGYLATVIGLVGVGTIIHSMVDFTIALFVWKPIQNVVSVPASVKKVR